MPEPLRNGMRNPYKYLKPYSGKDPVLDDGDVFEAFAPSPGTGIVTRNTRTE
ncbi:hypothetical protein Uis1B_1765 [Bifidobacterium margollesii]|uniref:Uncharacterized protein n=1 Tax=Bifidobacterium margollesii TaxID=2020964 RepID=A0A2N5J859_9BIFI|nr:hypothetical protein Uis1B_1765 [Bifidobacterium margollesii]